MAGSKLERVDPQTTARPVGLSDLQTGAASAGFRAQAQAWDAVGQLATGVEKRAVQYLTEESTERGRQDALMVTFTKDEMGRLQLPDMPSRATAYGKSFQAHLETKYLNETTVGLEDKARDLRRQNMLNPEGFRTQWDAYQRGLTSGVDPMFAGSVGLRAQEVGTQHYHGIADTTWKRDFESGTKLNDRTVEQHAGEFFQTTLAGGDTSIANARFEAALERGAQAGYYTPADVAERRQRRDEMQVLGTVLRGAQGLDFLKDPEGGLQNGLELARQLVEAPATLPGAQAEAWARIPLERRIALSNILEAQVRTNAQVGRTMRDLSERQAKDAQDRLMSELYVTAMTGGQVDTSAWTIALANAPPGTAMEVTRAWAAAVGRAEQLGERASYDEMTRLVADSEQYGVIYPEGTVLYARQHLQDNHFIAFMNQQQGLMRQRAAGLGAKYETLAEIETQVSFGLAAPNSKSHREALDLRWQIDGMTPDPRDPRTTQMLGALVKRYQIPPQTVVNQLDGAAISANPNNVEVIAQTLPLYRTLKQYPGAVDSLAPGTVDFYERLDASMLTGGDSARTAVTQVLATRSAATKGAVDDWWKGLGDDKTQKAWLDERLAGIKTSTGGSLLSAFYGVGTTKDPLPPAFVGQVKAVATELYRQGMTDHGQAVDRAARQVSKSWGTSSVGYLPGNTTGRNSVMYLPPEMFSVAGSTAYMEPAIQARIASIHPSYGVTPESAKLGSTVRLTPAPYADPTNPVYHLAVRMPDGTMDYAVDAQNNLITYNPLSDMRAEAKTVADARYATAKAEDRLALQAQVFQNGVTVPVTRPPPPLRTVEIAGLPRIAQYQSDIERAAEETGVDPRILVQVMRTESGGRHTKADGSLLTSPAGAIGLMQLLPGTAKDMRVDPRDPKQNILGGARYLRQQLDEFKTLPLALMAYNWGPQRVRDWIADGRPMRSVPKETRRYLSLTIGQPVPAGRV